ncbi:MAG: Rossmann-like and DUF2520 domain-containing protein [Bacteroidia bacterium]
MKKSVNISLFGTGNLAWKLGEALVHAGYTIQAVWGRNRSNRDALARLLEADSIAKIEEMPVTRLRFLAVSDGAIADLATRLLPEQNSLLVHAAGSGSLSWLEPHPGRGIFWPLQSIHKERTYDWKQIPLLVDAAKADDRQLLLEMGSSLSEKCFVADEKQRQLYHLAAVCTANFSNLLYGETFDLLRSEGLDHRLLLPILQSQLHAFGSEQSPHKRQTGPAARGDLATLEHQLQLLDNQAELAAIYRLLSEIIRLKQA